VEYSLRAIPLGGYVGFPDDDPESPYPPDDPDLLRNKVRSLLGGAWAVPLHSVLDHQWSGKLVELRGLDAGGTTASARVIRARLRGRLLTKTRNTDSASQAVADSPAA